MKRGKTMENKTGENYFIPLVKVSMIREKELPYTIKEIDSSGKAAELAGQILKGADREYMLIRSISCACKPVAVEIAAIGTLNGLMIQPREVFKHAILSNAAGIVLVHNHPSGRCTASKEDEEVTRRMMRAGEILGIPIEDHIIIGDGYFSFREEGLIAKWQAEVCRDKQGDCLFQAELCRE